MIFFSVKAERSVRSWLTGFFFAPVSDSWLTILRVGLALQVIAYGMSLRLDWNALFAGFDRGLVSRQLSEAIITHGNLLIPRVSWLVDIGAHLGLGESLVLNLMWSALLAGGFFLLVGLAARAAAILVWFLHLCAVQSGSLLSYGMDDFMTIGLFYLMLSSLPDRWAVDHRWRPPGEAALFRQCFLKRVLQLHLCLIYFFSGIAKAIGPDWWTGESLWRALTQPSFNQIPVGFLAYGKALLPLAGIGVVVLELGYPVVIWIRRARSLWLTAVCVMHVMIGLTMGMYLFAFIMIVLNLAAFARGWPAQRTRMADNKQPAFVS